MIARTAGGALIAAAVTATAVTLLAGFPEPSRELALIEKFPILGKTFASIAAVPVSTEEGADTTSFVPDPLLRELTPSSREGSYSEALGFLLDEQRELRALQEILYEREDALAASESDVQMRTWTLGEAERDATILPFDAARDRREAAKEALRESVGQRDRRRAALVEIDVQLPAAKRRVRDASAVALEARQSRDDATDSATRGAAYRGTLIERNVIVVSFREGESAGRIQTFLDSQRLEVESGIPELAVLVVRTAFAEWEESYEEEATRVRAIADRLTDSPVVLSAVQNTLMSGHVLPRTNKPYATGQPGRDWFRNDSLAVSGFPKAWNFKQVVIGKGVEVGVLDEGFSKDLCSTKPCDLAVNLLPGCGRSASDHGTATASVIGAVFDNEQGSDGTVPGVKLAGCAPKAILVDTSNLTPEEARIAREHKGKFASYLNGLNILLSHGVNVINASVGYNWGSLPSNNSFAQQLVEGQGKDVKVAMDAYPATVLVASAGNDRRQPAKFASPFNWAGLALPPGQRAENVIVVMALEADGKTPLADSNIEGNMSAIGVNVLTLVGKDKVGYHQGTSTSAPLVTSTIAMMRALDDTLSVTEIRSKLGVDSADPRLDAYTAILPAAGVAEDYLADLVKPAGAVDAKDFQAFERDFLVYQEAMKRTPPVFKSDLNGDGNIDVNDQFFCRIDLNGDDVVDGKDRDIMLRACHCN